MSYEIVKLNYEILGYNELLIIMKGQRTSISYYLPDSLRRSFGEVFCFAIIYKIVSSIEVPFIIILSG